MSSELVYALLIWAFLRRRMAVVPFEWSMFAADTLLFPGLLALNSVL